MGEENEKREYFLTNPTRCDELGSNRLTSCKTQEKIRANNTGIHCHSDMAAQENHGRANKNELSKFPIVFSNK